jgi:hypothetical protein
MALRSIILLESKIRRTESTPLGAMVVDDLLYFSWRERCRRNFPLLQPLFGKQERRERVWLIYLSLWWLRENRSLVA